MTIVRSSDTTPGSLGVYHRLRYGSPEPRIRRLDLVTDAKEPGTRTSLFHAVHLTDAHIVDVQSPGRYEFLQRMEHLSPALHLILPAFRPQEALTLHAVESMIATINEIECSPETGAPLDLVISTGDHTDNNQRNELDWFMRLMRGDPVSAGSGSPLYHGVQSVAWGDRCYWHPEPVPDWYKENYGFPSYDGLLEECMSPIASSGLLHPWISAHGNHDALVDGGALPDDVYRTMVIGSSKPYALPPDFDPLEHLDAFIDVPSSYLCGPVHHVPANPLRHNLTRRDYVAAHMYEWGSPPGHGFGPENMEDGSTYYVYDRCSAVRIIVLDTVNPGGHYQGSLGMRQFRWLEEQLIAAHSRYRDTRGGLVTTGGTDRRVILVSHHPARTLVNARSHPQPADEIDADLPRVLHAELEALLHRFPNVILWLNGHTHRNDIRVHMDPKGQTAGFWEVTTSSLTDWPSEARRVEIVSNGDGTLSILCTPVEHRAPPAPRDAAGTARLASIHRELAANDPHAGLARLFHGEPRDRTVDLVIPDPIP